MLRVFLVIDDYNELIYLQSLLKKLGFDVEGLQNQRKYSDVSLGFNPQILIATAKGKKVDGLALSRSITKRRGIPKIIALKSAGERLTAAELDECGVDQVLDTPINVKKLLVAIANLGSVEEAVLLEKYAKVMANSQITDEDAQAVMIVEDDGHSIDDIQRIKGALHSRQDQTEHVSGTGGDTRFPIDQGSGKTNIDSAEPVEAKGVIDNSEVSSKVSNEASSGEANVGEGNSGEANPRQMRFEKWIKEMGKLPPNHFSRERILDFNQKIRVAGSVEDIDEIETDRKSYVRALFNNKK